MSNTIKIIKSLKYLEYVDRKDIPPNIYLLHGFFIENEKQLINNIIDFSIIVEISNDAMCYMLTDILNNYLDNFIYSDDIESKKRNYINALTTYDNLSLSSNMLEITSMFEDNRFKRKLKIKKYIYYEEANES